MLKRNATFSRRLTRAAARALGALLLSLPAPAPLAEPTAHRAQEKQEQKAPAKATSAKPRTTDPREKKPEVSSASTSNAQPAVAQERLEAVDERLKAAKEWITGARQSEATTEKELRETETELAAARAAEDRLRQEADSLSAQADAMRTQVDQLTDRQQALRAEQADEIRVLNRARGGSAIKTVLSQEDPSKLPRLLAYFRYLDRARQQTLVALDENTRELTRSEQQLSEQLSQLATKRQALREETARIETLRDARSRALASLQSDIATRGGEMERLESERKQLAALLRELERAAAAKAEREARAAREAQEAARAKASTAGPSTEPEPAGLVTGPTGKAVAGPMRLAKGRLPWPTAGRINARFGSPKSGTDTRLRWEGLLITAPLGTRVSAVHAGEVVFAGWLRGFGTIAIIDHGSNLMSLYAHLDRVIARAGDHVDGGTAIGEVGLSGGRTSPALYFELRDHGNPVNPIGWLAKR